MYDYASDVTKEKEGWQVSNALCVGGMHTHTYTHTHTHNRVLINRNMSPLCRILAILSATQRRLAGGL